jgi:hypothetical protein
MFFLKEKVVMTMTLLKTGAYILENIPPPGGKKFQPISLQE